MTGTKTSEPRKPRKPRKLVSWFSWFALLLLMSSTAQAQSVAEAKAALRSGDYARARQGFEAVLRARPDQEESRIGLLQALRETGAYREASKRGDEFLQSGKGTAGLYLELARSARAVGEYDIAETHLRRALGPGGTRRAAAAELADLLESVGREAEANALWDPLLDEYRQGRVTGSQDLGIIALAGWRRGYVQDAKDIFIDATGAQPGTEASLEALTNFGYLFLDKYDATDAIGVFRDCLKINKSFAPALVGLALGKQYESSSETENFARAALEFNPNYVPALNLLAELRLQEERYDEALRLIRQALAVNPRDLESLSLEAVYCQIRGDEAGFTRAEQKVLGIHRSYGRLYHTLAENLVMRRKYREAVDFDRKALALSPKLYAAHASLGMNLMRIGDLKEGRAMVERAFAGDPFNVWAFNTLDLLDQMDTFTTLRSEHFVFRMAREDAAILPPYATRLAEEAYSRLTTRYSFRPEGPLQIEVFPDHGGFAVRTLGLPGLGALGVCFGTVVAIDSPRAREAGEFNWGSTLWHEFAHVMTLQMTKHNIPRWFSEGLSVYEEQQARPGWGDDLTAAFVKAYKEGKLLKVSELNAGMMRPKSPGQIELSYYQAGLFCKMIEEKFGFQKILESLTLFADNVSVEEVFRRTLGWDAAALDAQYAAYLDARLKPIAARLNFQALVRQAAAGRPPDKTLFAAILKDDPSDFFANLQMGALCRQEKDNSAAEGYLKKAESLFPDFVEPGNPYQILAEMYLETGREEEALAQFLGWARYDETALAPLKGAATILAKRKNRADEAGILDLLVYIDPYDAKVHAQLGDAALEGENWPAAIAAYRVLLGLNPPDPSGAHYNLARALFGAGRMAEAKRETLLALEIAPTFEKAQQLLLKLNERKEELPQNGGRKWAPGAARHSVFPDAASQAPSGEAISKLARDNSSATVYRGISRGAAADSSRGRKPPVRTQIRNSPGGAAETIGFAAPSVALSGLLSASVVTGGSAAARLAPGYFLCVPPGRDILRLFQLLGPTCLASPCDDQIPPYPSILPIVDGARFEVGGRYFRHRATAIPLEYGLLM
jgi:tetratricopeptide (TPR) repeat protein